MGGHCGGTQRTLSEFEHEVMARALNDAWDGNKEPGGVTWVTPERIEFWRRRINDTHEHWRLLNAE